MAKDAGSVAIQDNKWWINVLKYMFIFLPAIFYFALVNKYALNIPSQDDYDAILAFLIKYGDAHGLEKWKLCLAQHNEHRILSSRIIYLLYYGIFSDINFRNIIFIGNAQLLLVFTISVAFVKRALPRYWLIASFVMGLCLFDPNGWENADSAMGSIQNYGILLLFWSSIYFYNLPGKKYIIPALVLQILCIYSSGNGLIGGAFIVSFALLLRDKWKIIVSALCLLIFAPLYFFNYNYPPKPSEPVHIADVAKYFLHLVSAHLYFETMAPSLIAGIILLLAFLIFLPVSRKWQINRNALPFLCLSGFLLASMGTIALFRSNLGGPPYCSRYLIYPHFLFAIVFVFMIIKWKEKIFIWPLCVIFVLLGLRTYKTNTDGGIYGFEFQNKALKTNDYYYPDRNGGKATADKACQLKIYCIENNR